MRDAPSRCVSGPSRRGITLLEVMAAVTILAVAVMVLLSQFSESLDLSVNTRHLRQAQVYAAQKMEEVVQAWLLGDKAPGEGADETSGAFDENGEYTWELLGEEINLTTEEEQQDGEEDYIVQKVILEVKYPLLSGGKGVLRLGFIRYGEEEEDSQ